MTSCHSIERAKERIGINARTAEHVMRNALERGKDKTEFGWRQQNWLTAKETACGCRVLIYNDYCFIVNQDDLIVTCISCPAGLCRPTGMTGKNGSGTGSSMKSSAASVTVVPGTLSQSLLSFNISRIVRGLRRVFSISGSSKG